MKKTQCVFEDMSIPTWRGDTFGVIIDVRRMGHFFMKKTQCVFEDMSVRRVRCARRTCRICRVSRVDSDEILLPLAVPYLCGLVVTQLM